VCDRNSRSYDRKAVFKTEVQSELERLVKGHEQLEMARQIQLAILPHSIPQLPGLEIAARYSPMTSVAGDSTISSRSTTITLAS